MSRVALLDVNVLVALFDPDHVHHEAAHDWFADHSDAGWATCPLTQAGFVRVLASLGAEQLRPATLIEHLRTFCASPSHQFWPDALALTDRKVFDLSFATQRNLTDVYLLGLAWRRKGCLATFDRSIPLKAVVKATRATLEVIAPAT